MNEDTINLLDCWKALVKRKWLIGFIVGAAAIASVILSLLLPKIYAATTSILPPQQEGSVGMTGMGASQLPGGIGGLAGGFLGLKSPADLWVGILKSQTVRDGIIQRFDLMNAFKAQTIEDARGALNAMVVITKSKEDIISITVEDKDPQQAALLANAFVEELDKVNKRVVMSSGGRMRVFLEKRLNDGKVELVKIEEAVKAFQERNGAIKLDDQSKAIIDTIGKVKGQLMAKEVELQTFLSYATPNNPQAEILKSQIEELRGSMQELEEGKLGDRRASKGLFIPTAKMPDLALQYARLLRDMKVQETLDTLLTQQYEISRIQEAKDSPTVQVLDMAKVPGKKVKPKRAQIVLLSVFSATFAAVLLALFMEFVGQTKTRQPADKRDLALKVG
ncbi:MAG: lipopolysaccharide biosynthesis protein [Nitrospirae bacterium]|nr:lipopolysaccharide biosynthesis protein [Candidatus Manganitrophaceae bacterium]